MHKEINKFCNGKEDNQLKNKKKYMGLFDQFILLILKYDYFEFIIDNMG